MSATLEIVPAQALTKLGANLAEYQRVSGRSAVAVLKQKAAQLIFGNQNPAYGATFPGLVQLFMREAPREGAITADAIARGFTLERIRPAALARARVRMGGFKTIIARVREDEGRLRLSGVRLGVRGRRIIGGRKGRGGFATPGGLINDTAENRVLFPGFERFADEKRMNLRAVATVEEINLRESGRRFLGVAWLFRRWRRLAASDPARDRGEWRRVENMNPRSQLGLLGELVMSGQEETGNVTVRLTSFAPGTLAVGTARGLFAQAIAGVTADLAAYLARKQREALVADLQGRPSAA